MGNLIKAWRREPGMHNGRYRWPQPKSRYRYWKAFSHTPQWEPTLLEYQRVGNWKPGFHCVHVLENGKGQCGGNVFHLEDAEAGGVHICHVVFGPRHPSHLVKRKVKWSKL